MHTHNGIGHTIREEIVDRLANVDDLRIVGQSAHFRLADLCGLLFALAASAAFAASSFFTFGSTCATWSTAQPRAQSAPRVVGQ